MKFIIKQEILYSGNFLDILTVSIIFDGTKSILFSAHADLIKFRSKPILCPTRGFPLHRIANSLSALLFSAPLIISLSLYTDAPFLEIPADEISKYKLYSLFVLQVLRLYN